MNDKTDKEFSGLMTAFILLPVALLLDLFFYPSTLEDAYITFRYAENLIEGYGLGAWNAGSVPVEGYTTFLWMILLAAGHGIGVAFQTLSKSLGILAHLSLIAYFLWLPKALKGRGEGDHFLAKDNGRVSLLIAVITAFHMPCIWYSVTGMESVPFALLTAVVLLHPFKDDFYGYLFAFVVFAAYSLLRPEGAAIGFMAVAFRFFMARSKGKSQASTMSCLVGLVLATGVLLGIRHVLFSTWLPNTYYAKCDGAIKMHVIFGLKYTIKWVASHSILFIPVAFAFYRQIVKRNLRIPRPVMFLVFVAAFYVLFIIKTGGDNGAAFPYWRHGVHILPVVAALAGWAIVATFPKAKLKMWGLVVFGLLLINGWVLADPYRPAFDEVRSMVKNPRVYKHDQPGKYYFWFKFRVGHDLTVAATLCGEFPYVTRARFIDMLGLNNAYIAHFGKFDPDGPVDSKTDMNYVMDLRPDVIEGYVSATKILEGAPVEQIVQSRKKMVRTMLDSPIFQKEYLFLENGPYDAMDRALFFHRDFVKTNGHLHRLSFIPVYNTSLYSDK